MSDLIDAASHDVASGSRYALVIATSVYDDQEFRRLRAPVRDARDLAEVLSAPEIGAFAVTSVSEMTTQETRIAIQEFLSDRAVEDMVVVYLSCHGIRDRRGALYFVASDTKKDLLESTAVESQWLLDRFGDCAASSQVLILDCCFSGAFAARTKGGDQSDLGDLFEPRGRGRAILTASRSYEYSFEGDPLSAEQSAGSVYTTGLVEGLRSGEADTDLDGYISVLDAHEYAYSYARHARTDQTPQAWLYGSEGQVWIARNPTLLKLRKVSLSARQAVPTMADEPHSQVALFELIPGDLGPNCTIPHALDDQWVSRDLIREMASSRKSLHELGEARDTLIRREYLRALVTARKIVINRSYLLKNQVISRDYKTDPVSRAAFVELLRVGAIVPFLLKERTPIQSEFAADPDAAEGARIWNELLSEHDPDGRGKVEIQCVRLSWDDTENDRLVQERLIDAFAAGIKNATSFDYRRMLDDVGADPSDTFEERLRLIPKMSASWAKKGLTRTALYQRYVIEGQEDVSTGKYDFTKPDIVAFKWLFDLTYNSNLAAALGLALVAPADSGHRSVIYRPKGPQQAARASSGPHEGGYLQTMVMETVQDAIFVGGYGSASLAMFDGLTLSDVVAIRNSDEWRTYSRALDSLLAEPWLMSHPERGLPFVYGRYAALIEHISGIMPRDLASGDR
jgi:Caspase domain